MSKKILLTGASGFTGRHFINLANELGYECIALCHQETSHINGCSTCIIADLTDKAKLKAKIGEIKPDYVVHLAAISFVEHGDSAEIYKTNLQGTINLLDVLIELNIKVKKVLIASSGNVYGNSTELPISESTCLSPVNDYAVSKVSMELAAKLRSDKLPIIIVRPFNYTGVGQAKHFLIPKIVNAFKNKKEDIELGNLDVSRDFSDVRDVVNAYMCLLKSTTKTGVFNISSGKSISLLDIIELLNNLSGYNIKVTVNPDFVRNNEIKELFGSNKQLVQEIGDFQNYSLIDTLSWMMESET